MNNLSLFGIFIEGLLSFLSPCVLPLIPLYISYLGGENYKNKIDVLINTFSFVLGIVTTFIIFGMSISFFKEHILKYQEVISIIGGTIIIVFALHEIGLINISSLNKEFSFKEKLNLNKMSFLKAYLFGFLFSFAWSPCIGPLLANALLMAATNTNGILYLVAFALGLIIPFIIAGLFSSFILDFINNKKNISQYVTKIAGIIMLCFGIYMIYNAASNINNNKKLLEEYQNGSNNYLTPFEKKYIDVNGNDLAINEYADKYVYINFIASWCDYCKQEIPDFHEFCNNNDDIKCLYVMSPKVSGEGDVEFIKQFVKESNITIQTIIDEKGELHSYLGVSSFPTLSVISPDTIYLDSIPGALNSDYFSAIHEQAKTIYSQLKEN